MVAGSTVLVSVTVGVGRRPDYGRLVRFCPGGLGSGSGWSSRRVRGGQRGPAGLGRRLPGNNAGRCALDIVANGGNLGFRTGVAIDTGRFFIGLAGQFGIHVTKIFMRHAITRIVGYGLVQRNACAFVLAVGCVQDREVVVRFREVGKVLGQFQQHRNGLGRLVLLRQDDALAEAQSCIGRFLGQSGLDPLHRVGQLTSLDQAGNLGRLVASGQDGRSEQGAA